ncbi:MAG: ABC transporter ATP-binding protein [Candidatus Methanoplasma sp.]|jgi:iron complex transport system ATP-binding protein|nr:ABC transporter ATP-binding protein [Candidatus Methanoplasma sp.]
MRLTVEGVAFSYGSSPILDGVTFSADSGEILGIIGPNGSGKTTLLKCINRILSPVQGEILLDSESLRGMRPRDRARLLGYVPQNAVSEFSAPTVYEVVMMGRAPREAGWRSGAEDERIAWEAMADMGVDSLASRPFNRISSGQSQRVLIARAMAQEASVLLLDEPTSNLDVRYQIEVMDIVRRLSREKGVGVCAVLHDMDTAMRYCDKLIMLEGGRIAAAGDTADVLTPENILETYGVGVAIDNSYGRPHVIIL